MLAKIVQERLPADSPAAHLLPQGRGVVGSSLSYGPTIYAHSTGLPAPYPLPPLLRFQLMKAGEASAFLEPLTVADIVNAQ